MQRDWTFQSISGVTPFWRCKKYFYWLSSSAACHKFFLFRATGQQLLLLGYLMYFIIIAAYSLYISEVLNLPVLCAIFKFLTGVSVSISLNRGSTIPDSVTKSRRSGPSPTKHNGQSKKNLLLEQRD